MGNCGHPANRALSKKGQLFSQPFSPIMGRRSILRNHLATAPAEAIVDSGRDKVGIAANAVGGKERAGGGREGRRSGIEEEMVGLNRRRPIRSKALFETRTHPAT